MRQWTTSAATDLALELDPPNYKEAESLLRDSASLTILSSIVTYNSL